MSHLTESLLGWLTIMGMVFGGVGVLFFVMFAIRSLVLLARRVRIVRLESKAMASQEPQAAAGTQRS